jgi:hypothetical protein
MIASHAAERQALADLLDRTKVGDLGVVPVQEVVLFKSDLQPGGAVYTALARGLGGDSGFDAVGWSSSGLTAQTHKARWARSETGPSGLCGTCEIVGSETGSSGLGVHRLQALLDVAQDGLAVVVGHLETLHGQQAFLVQRVELSRTSLTFMPL